MTVIYFLNISVYIKQSDLFTKFKFYLYSPKTTFQNNELVSIINSHSNHPK